MVEIGCSHVKERNIQPLWPRRPCQTMHARARGCYKKRGPAAGLGVMLVGKGGVADEGGGAVASNDSGGELWTQGDHLHG